MKNILIILLILIILIVINRISKKEEMTNKIIINPDTYFKKWPHGGYYVKDLKNAYQEFLNYISNLYLDNLVEPAIIIDIDDTILFTDPLNLVGIDKVNLPPNPYIWLIPFICRDFGVKVIILTARNEKWLEHTKNNLNLHNIPYDKIIMNKTKSSVFKVQKRKNLRRKYTIIAEIGDQWPDVSDTNDSLAIKLPSYDDLRLYIKKPISG